MTARACPAWCAGDYAAGRRTHHGRPAGTAEDVAVALAQTEGPGMRRTFVAACARSGATALLSLEDAAGLAGILRGLGHRELADLIAGAVRTGSPS
jgi:hypothetical protein